MKKLLSVFLLLFSVVTNVNAITLREAYNEMNKLPDLEGTVSNSHFYNGNGWVGSIPLNDASVTYKAHQVGNGQTVYYGSKVDELSRLLPKEQLVLSGTDFQNLIYFYARPIDKENYELLIMIDQAYQGQTITVLGTVNRNIVESLKDGKVEFTPDHQIKVLVPILICGDNY